MLAGQTYVTKSFHETFERETVKPPTDRATGIVFTVVALIVAVLWRNDAVVWMSAAGIAAVLLALSLLAPWTLKPLNFVWFRFGLLLHKVVNPIVMLLMFAVAIVPAGLIMQCVRDPLRSRRPGGDTYWIKRNAEQLKTSSMKDQF